MVAAGLADNICRFMIATVKHLAEDINSDPVPL